MAIAKLVLLLVLPFLVSYGFAVDVEIATYVIDGVRYTEEGVLKLGEKWAKEKKTLNILVVGETGAGKSTLINFLFGIHKADEGALGHSPYSRTKVVEERSEKINGVLVTIYDTPGFNERDKSLESIVKKIEQAVAKNDIDLLLYCKAIDVARGPQIRKSDIEALQAVTALRASVWEKALVVLTFANKVEESQEGFSGNVKRWKTLFYEIFTKDCKIPPNIVRNIPVVPAGYESPSLPDRENWLSELWVQVFRRLKFRTMLVFLHLSKDRLTQRIDDIALRSLHTSQPLVLSSMTKEEYKRRKDMASACAVVGSMVGFSSVLLTGAAAAGASAAAAGTSGAVLGLKVGTVLNPMVGGLIGAAFGGVVGVLVGIYTKPENTLYDEVILQSLARALHEEYVDKK